MFFFFSSRRRHTRCGRDWSSDVCSSDLSWHSPAETFNTNTISQVNLLEAVRAQGKAAPRFLAIGSSEEYGLVHEDELPIKESNPLRPLSPYAVSKVTQDLMGYQYFKSYGLPILRARA